MKYYDLKDGNRIPAIGLGTWQLRGKKCYESVRNALEVGYEMIDTADFYFNHSQVGKAVKDSGREREKIFITSKVFYWNLTKNKVIKSGENNVKQLGLDYIDLYLIHWPNKKVPMEDTFEGLLSLKEGGLIKSIGVSNFTIEHIKKALKIYPNIVVNQVEYHPSLNQKELKDFCERNEIIIEAYSSLSGITTEAKKKIETIAEKYGKSVNQIILSWLINNNIIAIPRSSKKEHIIENLSSIDITLDSNDVNIINSLNENRRSIKPFIAEFDL